MNNLQIVKHNKHSAKSRRDDTLLTVGFNLRKLDDTIARQSPAGTALCSYKCRPCGTWVAGAVFPTRRLKPTVNKMSSLRDFQPITRHINFQFLIKNHQ
jgi:hypothetical protein